MASNAGRAIHCHSNHILFCSLAKEPSGAHHGSLGKARGSCSSQDIDCNSYSPFVTGNAADSWAAAQCLALEGFGSFQVIKRILSQIFDQKDKTTDEQACVLLSRLSKQTVSIKTEEEEQGRNESWL